jgi:hypothetical protein
MRSGIHLSKPDGKIRFDILAIKLFKDRVPEFYLIEDGIHLMENEQTDNCYFLFAFTLSIIFSTSLKVAGQ